MTVKRRIKRIEWIGGIIKLPIVIQDTDTHQPELIVWLNEDAFVLTKSFVLSQELCFEPRDAAAWRGDTVGVYQSTECD